MAKQRVKGIAGMWAFDWVDAVLILAAIYGLVGLETWWSGGSEDLAYTEVLLFPAMIVGPMIRRFTLGVPVRHVKASFSISGLFATMAIVFGSLIAAAGGWLLYARATDAPPELQIPERDEARSAQAWGRVVTRLVREPWCSARRTRPGCRSTG